MGETDITLEAWIEQAGPGLDGKKRELLDIFKRDWWEGKSLNPLLFPEALAPSGWARQFDWFLDVETFDAPPLDVGPAPICQVPPPKPAPEPAPSIQDGATVVVDSIPVPEIQSSGDSSETDKTVVIDAETALRQVAATAARTEKRKPAPKKTAPGKKEPQKASGQPALEAKPTPPSEDMELDLDDLVGEDWNKD
ncbi:MAG: hypothetical protein KKB20_26110 [Proteobacteria bacterium]|nr:hypothetical protein [Pseudomonadota bacterium]